MLPFLQIENELGGAYRPCCLSTAEFGNSRRVSLMDAWNSEPWRELRKQFAVGERPASCRSCWEQEDLGLWSLRQQNAYWHDQTAKCLESFDASTGRMRTPPRLLGLKSSNLCNLACRMCSPFVSTSFGRIWDAELAGVTQQQRHGVNWSFPDREALLGDVRSVGPGLRQVSFGGGEPLLDPLVPDVLRALRPWSGWIRVHANTNLSRLRHGGLETLELMSGFEHCLLTVSVDGPPALQGYVRSGLDVRAFERNLEQVRRAPRFSIDSNTAIQILNALQLPETLDYVLRFVRPGTLLASYATGSGSEFLDVRYLPADLKALLSERLTSFAQRISLERYPMASPEVREHARSLALNVDRFARSADLWTEAEWARASAYYRKLDRIHGTDLASVNPVLAARFDPDWRAAPAPTSPASGATVTSAAPSPALAAPPIRPLVHVPAYVPYSTPADEVNATRTYVLELLLTCLHSLRVQGMKGDLLVTTNDAEIVEVIARYRARTGHRLELMPVSSDETIAAFGIEPARLPDEVCSKYLWPKFYPIVRRLAPWIVHVDFDTVAMAELDFTEHYQAELSVVDANQLAGWPAFVPSKAYADFFELQDSPRPTWSWLNTGVFSVRGSGFDLCAVELGHYLRNLGGAAALGITRDGDEALLNALATREPGRVSVLRDPSTNLLAYYLPRHPTWLHDARIVHFHSLKPRTVQVQQGRPVFSCPPSMADRITLDYYLAVLVWCGHLHAVARTMRMQLPMALQVPADFLDRELPRVLKAVELGRKRARAS